MVDLLKKIWNLKDEEADMDIQDLALELNKDINSARVKKKTKPEGGNVNVEKRNQKI